MKVLILLLLTSTRIFAQAIVDAENKFPSVGVIMVWTVDKDERPMELRGFASGTLIADRVMVTAGHFTAPFKALKGVLPPSIRVFASFSPTDARDPATWIPVIGYAVHPSMPFCPPPPQCDPTDEILVLPLQIGVADAGLIFLAHVPDGIKPMQLAQQGALETPEAEKSPMVIVGYGTTSFERGNFSLWDGKRRIRFSTLQSVCDETWAIWSLPSFVCSGDSGGAIIMNIDPNRTKDGERIVANVSDGGFDCRSHNNNNRLDTASIQKWIQNTIPNGFALSTAEKDLHDKECPFGPARNLGPTINGSLFDGGPTVSTNENTLIFTSTRDMQTDQEDLFISKRVRTQDPWSKAEKIEIVSDPIASEFSPRLSYDGKAHYFGSNRPGGFGAGDLYVSTRESTDDPWGQPANLGPLINTKLFEGFPTRSSDGNTLYFERSTSISSHDSDIWVTTRENSKEPWSMPQPLGNTINGPGSDFSASISADGLALYFASERKDNIGIVDIWVSTRQSLSDQWSEPQNLGPNVNTKGSMTLAPYITASGNSLYFMSSRSGGLGKPDCKLLNCFDLYIAEQKCRSDSADSPTQSNKH